MIISKQIYDPTWSTWSHPNRMGRTVGLVVHTPKYWDCHNYDFYANQFDEMRNGELTEEEKERRYLTKKAHANCKRKHLSNRGYAYWVAPKHRYTFRYMGPLWEGQKWWKPFSVSANRGTYVRWFDTGPKPPEPPERKTFESFNDPTFRAIMEENNRKFNAALSKARNTMLEYEKMRDGK